jgi:hypothetical protein
MKFLFFFVCLIGVALGQHDDNCGSLSKQCLDVAVRAASITWQQENHLYYQIGNTMWDVTRPRRPSENVNCEQALEIRKYFDRRPADIQLLSINQKVKQTSSQTLSCICNGSSSANPASEP